LPRSYRRPSLANPLKLVLAITSHHLLDVPSNLVYIIEGKPEKDKKKFIIIQLPAVWFSTSR